MAGCDVAGVDFFKFWLNHMAFVKSHGTTASKRTALSDFYRAWRISHKHNPFALAFKRWVGKWDSREQGFGIRV
jgi:hypothetical protein